MSLINDALKKAQRQRTGDAPPLASLPGVGGESATKIAKRAKPTGFNSQLTRLALGAGGVLLVLVLGGFLIARVFGHRPAPTAKEPAAPSLAEAKPEAAEAKPSEPAALAKAPKPAVIFTVPVRPPPAPEPGLVSSITTSAGGDLLPSAPAALPPAKAPPVEPAKPKPPVKLDGKAISFIENLHIAGIRASATDSKVLMNDRVYRIGDIVEHQLGLKLTGITANSLTFEDERGGVYTHNF